MAGHKRCPGCRKSRPISAFRSGRGVNRLCATCRRSRDIVRCSSCRKYRPIEDFKVGRETAQRCVDCREKAQATVPIDERTGIPRTPQHLCRTCWNLPHARPEPRCPECGLPPGESP